MLPKPSPKQVPPIYSCCRHKTQLYLRACAKPCLLLGSCLLLWYGLVGIMRLAGAMLACIDCGLNRLRAGSSLGGLGFALPNNFLGLHADVNAMKSSTCFTARLYLLTGSGFHQGSRPLTIIVTTRTTAASTTIIVITVTVTIIMTFIIITTTSITTMIIAIFINTFIIIIIVVVIIITMMLSSHRPHHHLISSSSSTTTTSSLSPPSFRSSWSSVSILPLHICSSSRLAASPQQPEFNQCNSQLQNNC